MTISDIVAKRKARWEEKHDLDYDRTLVSAAARLILSEPALIAEVQEKPYLLIECCFLVVNKERQTVPFFLNEVQKDFIRNLEERGTSKPFFILKGRQEGFTTLITAIQLSFAIVRKNFSGFTMADRADNTAAIFGDKARTVYERLPEELKPTEKFNSQRELFFDKLNSSWRIATATDQVGRSRTLNFVHFSEVAFYECDLADLQAGIGEAIVAGAIVVYETTANGFNQAKELWDSGTCVNLFYPWWLSAEYRSTEYGYLDTDDEWLRERQKLLFELGCDREQVTWYSKKYAGYLDKDLIKQEYPITAQEAFVASGSSVFDLGKITSRLAMASRLPPPRTGIFDYRRVFVKNENVSAGGVLEDTDEWRLENIAFHDDRSGYIRIHKEPITKTDPGGILLKKPYTVGVDTAGDGSDWYAAKVIDNMTGETAATVHVRKIDEDIFAEQILCLARYYHNALIAPEANFSTAPIRTITRKYGYTNLYVRQRMDAIDEKREERYGFLTTPITRPVIIANLVSIMRQTPQVECDVETLKEMSIFVKKENGRIEAEKGGHDDLVMALAIAHFCSEQQGEHEWLKEEAPVNDFISKYFHVDNDSGGGEYMSWE